MPFVHAPISLFIALCRPSPPFSYEAKQGAPGFRVLFYIPILAPPNLRIFLSFTAEKIFLHFLYQTDLFALH